MNKNTSTALAVGVGGALTLVALRLLKAKQAGGDDVEERADPFASHATDHDGRGLVELSPGRLWHVTARFSGSGPPWRRMVVYRPPGPRGRLVLLSPTAVSGDVMEKIDALGEVDVLVVPNPYHRTDVAVYKGRYPDARVASPPGWVRKRVGEVADVDMDCRELSERYRDSIRVVRIGGIGDPDKEEEGDFEYAYEFRLADGSWAFVVTDTLFNFREGGVMNWVFGCRGIEQPDGSVTPRVGRISKWFMHSRTECAEFYHKIAKRDDISAIVMAHGEVVTSGIKEAFSAIAHDVVR